MTHPAAATRFGNYEILYELKSGGMGAVLLARRRGPGAFEQLVAIKTIRPEYAQAPAVRAMFLDEAAILARLNHPGIAHVHDFGEDGGTLYMVMEYVAGIPFRDLVQLPPLVVARAIAEAARGLHAAHEVRDLAGHQMGLVHRDISPDNLMLGFDGHVKVIDFGIALVKNRQAPVTEFGTVKGKPPYMSPEQVKNEAMDRRSDVFSLAVVAWEMLTGRNLFEGDSIYAVAIAVEQQAIAAPSHARGEALPLGLDAAVMNALDRDLARRTPTAAAFAESLDGVLQSAGGESLATWTERELADARETHRTWLAQLAAGESRLPKLVGRSTAQVTEVAPLGQGAPAAPVQAVTPVAGPDTRDAAVAEPGPGTSIGSAGSDLDDGLDVPPRRRLAPIVLVLLALLVAVGGVAIYMAMPRQAPVAAGSGSGSVVALTPRDAASDAAIANPPPDAAEPAPMVVDAGIVVAIDAGHHHHGPVVVAKLDGGQVTADAPAVAAPTGTGYLTTGCRAVFCDVMVDGRKVGVTPMTHTNPHTLSAGKHTIQLIAPDTGVVKAEKTVTVSDGDHIDVEAP